MTNLTQVEKIAVHSIDLYINSVCNLKCITCFLGDDYFSRRAAMTVATVSEIASWACRMGVTEVALLGGEPTLHPDILEIFDTLSRHGLDIRLITNGNRRLASLIDAVSQYVSRVYVSIDAGTACVNDRLRGRGSFDSAVAALRICRAAEIPTVLTCTLTNSTLDQLESLVSLAEQHGCETLNLHWLSNTGRARSAAMSPSLEEWRNVAHRVRRLRRATTTAIDFQTAFLSIDGGKGASPCRLHAIENLQFMPDARVVGCGLLAEDRVLHGYEWLDGNLWKRSGCTELSLLGAADDLMCPVRLADPEEKASEPVCIYNRLIS